MEEKEPAQPSFMRPTKWTLLLTGENHGLVGPHGSKWHGHPEHYERVDVVEASVSAAEQTSVLTEQVIDELFFAADSTKPGFEYRFARAIAAHLARQAQAAPVAWMKDHGPYHLPSFTVDKEAVAVWERVGKPLTPLYAAPVAQEGEQGSVRTGPVRAEQVADVILDLIHCTHDLNWFSCGHGEADEPFSSDAHERTHLVECILKVAPQFAAPATSSDSVDTPELWSLLREWAAAGVEATDAQVNAIIAHIDSLIADRVAGARKEALEEAANVCESDEQEYEIGRCCAAAIRALIQSPASDSQKGGAAC